MLKNQAIEREAQWGERMIELKVRFWTDKIAGGKGRIHQKHAWGSGVVRMERNRAHNIDPQKAIPFNSLMELLAAIEKLLIQHDITIHPSTRMRKYFASEGAR